MECTKVLVRRATNEDLSELLSLNIALFRHQVALDSTLNVNWTESSDGQEYFRGRIRDGLAFVALVDDRAAGYVAGRVSDGPTFRSARVVCELQNIFVLEEFRSLGIGAQLVQAFLEECVERGAVLSAVSVLSVDARAVQFYQRCGFQPRLWILERRLD